jgi:ubiquinone/menaquinone biosynthesis C-methylase UbiE
MAERAHPELRGFQNRWFGLKRSRYRRKLIERYRFCNEYIKGGEVLDVPCGVGWGTSMLRGYRRAMGVDLADDAIKYAREHYARPGRLEFSVGNMAELPVEDASYDVVICLEGFEHVPQTVGKSFLDESRRVLRPAGMLLMTCPVLNEYGEDTGNPHHVYEYPEEELIDLLNRNFRVLKLERTLGPEGPEYRCVVSSYGRARYAKRVTVD